MTDTPKKKTTKTRRVARRTLYRAIEQARDDAAFNDGDTIGDLLAAVKDAWFHEAN